MSIAKIRRRFLMSGVALAVVASSCSFAISCTRAIYAGPNGTVITPRSNDWIGSQSNNLWRYPRGVSRNGGGAPGAITWVSKYGSIAAAGWDLGTIDGMNEKGLSANALYLAESDHGKPAADDPRKPLSLTAWAQYALDNFATVAEAVEAMKAAPFYIVGLVLNDRHAGTTQMSLSDPTGDSAIFEYIGGKFVIHHGPSTRS